MVIDNLKKKECMHSVHSIRTGRADPYRCTRIGFHELVAYGVMQARHGSDARRGGIVDKHRSAKITGCEHLGDMGKMFFDLLPGRSVDRIVRGDSDFSSVRKQPEVMGGRLM